MSTEKPKPTWKEIKAPGTFIPGLIKAGTYYTDSGKQFWYVTKGKGILNIELKNESYKRLVLGLDSNENGQKKLAKQDFLKSDLEKIGKYYKNKYLNLRYVRY